MTSAGRSLFLLAVAVVASAVASITALASLRSRSLASDAAVPLGDVVLWHDLDEGAGLVLDGLLDRFHALYPDVRVRAYAIPPMQFTKRVLDGSRSGTAPDLLLASNVDLRSELRGVVADVADTDLLTHLKPLAIETVRDGAAVLGVPLSVETHLLYYDATRVDEPAADLITLLAEVRAGKALALPVNFFDAAWGVDAFGGTIRDGRGRVVLNQGGFEAWLRWLLEVQELPTTVLSPDREELVRRFAGGGLSYLVASSSDLPYLRSALGNRLGATTLPRGPAEAARPYLVTEVLALGLDASPSQRATSLALARFLASPQQQRTWMVQRAQVPTSLLVGIDRFALPSVHAVRLQSFTTLPYQGDALDRALVFEVGDDVYTRVLAGVLDPREAVAVFEELNRRAGFASPAPAIPSLPNAIP